MKKYVNIESKDKLKELDITNCMCYYFDYIIKFYFILFKLN